MKCIPYVIAQNLGKTTYPQKMLYIAPVLFVNVNVQDQSCLATQFVYHSSNHRDVLIIMFAITFFHP